MAAAQHTDDETGEAEIDGLRASAREEPGFTVDVADNDDERSPRLLIQGGPGGYQLDMWWNAEVEGTERELHSNNWVNFGEQNSDYPHDNRHDRDAELSTDERNDEAALIIHDPDPRAAQAGYGGADLIVKRHPDGFFVLLEWTNEMDEHHLFSVVVPFFDARIKAQRADYYDYMYPLQDTTGGPIMGDNE